LRSFLVVSLFVGLLGICGCGRSQGTSETSPGSTDKSSGTEAASGQPPQKPGQRRSDQPSEGEPHGTAAPDPSPPTRQSSESAKTFGVGSRASEEYREKYGPRIYSHAHVGGTMAKSLASVSNVKASAVLEPGSGNPPWVLKVNYRVEYRSGIRPAAVRVLVERKGYPVRSGGAQQLQPGKVSNGTINIPLATGRRPVQVKVRPYTRFGTPVGAEAKSIIVH
jgi:hypothetical protein